jgi:uncharacterized protein YbjT (DUF2867 family)
MTSGSNMVAVTGATGFVGRHVVRELLARGFRVRALIRDRAKAKETLPQVGVELVEGDVTTPGDVARLVAGCGAVVHLVGIIREATGGQTFERMHVLATRVVTEACEKAGVKRYVHMSALGVSPEGRAEYQKTKWRAEEIVRRSGLEWTIFRPGLIHGADGEFVRMMADLVSGEVPPYYFTPYFVRRTIDTSVPLGPVEFESAKLQPVAVEDVASAFVKAISTQATVGEIYNLTGPETYDWPTLLTTFRDVLPGSSKSIKPFYVPGDHAEIIARVAKVLGLAKLLPFDAGQAIMAQEDSMSQPDKVAAHLGIRPRAFRKSLEAYAAEV